MKLSDLSESERTLVETELSERLKDLVYMKSGEYGKRVLSDYNDTELDGNDTLRVTFTFEFIWNDILQIIGRDRREGEK